MKTCLYTLSYLEGNDRFGNNRLMRNIKYVNYYRNLKSQLGHELMVFGDNASHISHCEALLDVGRKDIAIMRFDQHLTRRGPYDYPYCWRGLYAMRELINEGFEKIISCDSDCFILTQRLADYIRNLNSGWTTFWCERYGFPEASVHILCKDSFSLFHSYIGQCRWEDRKTNAPMEVELPFTHVERKFRCDRWGESKEEQKTHMDLFCQSYDAFKPVFGKFGT